MITIKELRCSKCNKLLLKHGILGELEIKCTRCGESNVTKIKNVKFGQGIVMQGDKREVVAKNIKRWVLNKYPNAVFSEVEYSKSDFIGALENVNIKFEY